MERQRATSLEQKMTLERLESLYDLIGRMNSVYKLPELLEFVIDRVLNLTGGRRGLLLLIDDPGANSPQVAVVRGEELDQHALDQALQFVSNTVIQDVLARGEPRLVRDLQADERYEGLASHATVHVKGVRSVLAVPLKVEDELVGLAYIDHPRRAIFEQGDLDFLSAFASQAALAINRARQHQRQLEELTLLNELSRSVVQVLDLDEVLTRIVYEAIRMLKVETGSVLLLEEASGELIFATSVSNGQRIDIPTRLRPDQGIAGAVVSTGEPVCVSQVDQDPRWYGEVETGFVTHSILCVPLKLNGRVLGVLEVLNKRSPHGFDEGDIARLSAFAASATVAIENARLFEEASQARQLRALNEVALALNSTLDLPTILNTGLEKALAVLTASGGVIHLCMDKDATTSRDFQVSRGLAQSPTQAVKQLQATVALSNELLNDQVEGPLIVNDTGQEESPRSALAAAGIEALAMAPIKVGRETRGTLAVLNTRPHAYQAEEINLLVSIAHIIGLAVQNAAHYNQVRAQAMHLAYLNEIGSAMTRSLHLAHVLKVIFEGVNALLETERTSVFLIEPVTNELVLHYGSEGDVDIRLPAPWQGIAGWVATHDQPALVNDTLSDPRHLRQVAVDTGYEAHSILCVPLKIEDQVIGVVEVLNKTGGRQFDHHDQAMLLDLTKWAAIAIHNARLFDERVQAYQRLNDEQVRRVTAEARGAMAAVILEMAHTMNNVVGAIKVWALTLEQAAQTTPQEPVAHFADRLRHIRANAEEAIELIGNIRAPLEQATLAPTDVHACLAAAIQSCFWPSNVRLQQNYGTDLPLVKANAKRLQTVFQNLLLNAIQVLTATGGEIRLRTRRTAAGQAEITIGDNGPGIPAEIQEHMFKPGTSDKEGGLGIGLWLAETFIHQFEGHIAFTSSASAGTTFVITLAPMESAD